MPVGDQMPGAFYQESGAGDLRLGHRAVPVQRQQRFTGEPGPQIAIRPQPVAQHPPGGFVAQPVSRLQERHPIGKDGVALVDTDEVVEKSDFLSINLPLCDETRNIIEADTLSRMKQGSFLVNLARGGIVDENALLDALTSGHLGGAALDVHANEGDGKISPLAELSNVILTPHIGAMTVDSQRAIGERVIEIIEQRS